MTETKKCGVCGGENCPSVLHRSMSRGKEVLDPQWQRVAKLREKGKGKRVLRRILGIKGKPMPDDVKERLRSKKEGAS